MCVVILERESQSLVLGHKSSVMNRIEKGRKTEGTKSFFFKSGWDLVFGFVLLSFFFWGGGREGWMRREEMGEG